MQFSSSLSHLILASTFWPFFILEADTETTLAGNLPGNSSIKLKFIGHSCHKTVELPFSRKIKYLAHMAGRLCQGHLDVIGLLGATHNGPKGSSEAGRGNGAFSGTF